jgi:hypothetical protein
LGQYKTYNVQEQVVDMQQNVRVAISRMMKETRMAGFGNVSSVLPNFTANGGPFNNIINPGDNVNNVDGQMTDQVTIIGAFEQISTLASQATPGTNTIELAGKASEFDDANRRYICIGGLETHTISTDPVGNTITLNENVVNRFPINTPVFKVKAITYRLRMDNRDPKMPVLTREDNTDGGGSQVMAENIENLQFKYILRDGTDTDLPASSDCPNIRIVNVTVKARTREKIKLFEGTTEEFRTRTIASNVNVRNMVANP